MQHAVYKLGNSLYQAVICTARVITLNNESSTLIRPQTNKQQIILQYLFEVNRDSFIAMSLPPVKPNNILHQRTVHLQHHHKQQQQQQPD